MEAALILFFFVLLGALWAAAHFWKQADHWQEEWYRAQVQLAGCLMAAEGVGVKQAARPGGYGWTPAYQKTLDLRAAYDNLVDDHVCP